ncbi:MAG TPA: uracil-DNA glycosylase family protein [Candidatus Limnocylindria bacterium]|nr:uracil-DNA glycosylase family protein [Candidatus Limnocylindria bacterium]
MSKVAGEVLRAAAALRDAVDPLRFSPPVTHVYNPLNYAWAAHEQYVKKFATAPKRIVFLGMNPGPFGMAQTGVPFGEVSAVRDWMGVRAGIKRPSLEHPKRPVLGFNCPRCEVSGQRLWGLFAKRFGAPENFFREHYVVNYCPLAFLSETGSNLTPDKLPKRAVEKLFTACDAHLTRVIETLRPEWMVGVGGFAFERVRWLNEKLPHLRAAQILHPSPASPAANRDWAGAATKQLQQCGTWPLD